MSLVQKMWQRAGVAFRAKVGKELSGHGLLYEDVLVETEEVPAALPCLQLGLELPDDCRVAFVNLSKQKPLLVNSPRSESTTRLSVHCSERSVWYRLTNVRQRAPTT